MRFLPGFVLAVLAAVASRAEIPPLLDEAWTSYVADIDHWAYTETTRVLDAKGEATRETVTRYDPSKPYAEQFTVLSHTGKTPVEQMQAGARERGENRGKHLERPGGVENDAQPRIMLSGAPAIADLDNARVVEETEHNVTYSIPLRAEVGKGAMIEKFETHVRVSKLRRAFDHVDIRLRDPMRMKVVAKVRELTFAIDFAIVDPQFAPVATDRTHFYGPAAMRVRAG